MISFASSTYRTIGFQKYYIKTIIHTAYIRLLLLLLYKKWSLCCCCNTITGQRRVVLIVKQNIVNERTHDHLTRTCTTQKLFIQFKPPSFRLHLHAVDRFYLLDFCLTLPRFRRPNCYRSMYFCSVITRCLWILLVTRVCSVPEYYNNNNNNILRN